MPITVKCPCGRALKVPDSLAGQKGRCPACNGVVHVPEAVLDAEPVEPPGSPRRDSYRPRDDDDRPPRRRDEDDDDRRPRRRDDDRPSRSRPRLAREDDDRPVRRSNDTGGSSWGLNPSVGGGLLAMIGALVWFFAGLAFGIIFWYPPILFILGLIAFIRGLAGGE